MTSSPILALAAAVIAFACPAPAAAQPAFLAPATPVGGRLGPAFGPAGLPGLAGRGGNTNPAWSMGDGVRLGSGHRPARGHGPGPSRGYGGYGFYGGYGGGLIEDPESYRDQGFFAGSADARAENGRAAYDYDRAYPYDWYREGSARTSLVRAEPRPTAAPDYRCRIERAGVRVCRGRR